MLAEHPETMPAQKSAAEEERESRDEEDLPPRQRRAWKHEGGGQGRHQNQVGSTNDQVSRPGILLRSQASALLCRAQETELGNAHPDNECPEGESVGPDEDERHR